MLKMLSERFAKLREELETIRVVGEAGAGLVKVTADGQRAILAVEIDPELCTPDNVGMLQDMVLAACADAQRKATACAAEKLGALTAGLPIPPGLFS